MRGMHEAALDEYFGTPVVDAFDPRLLMAAYVCCSSFAHVASSVSLHVLVEGVYNAS